jgi:hypothetical protein
VTSPIEPLDDLREHVEEQLAVRFDEEGLLLGIPAAGEENELLTAARAALQAATRRLLSAAE